MPCQMCELDTWYCWLGGIRIYRLTYSQHEYISCRPYVGVWTWQSFSGCREAMVTVMVVLEILLLIFFV